MLSINLGDVWPSFLLVSRLSSCRPSVARVTGVFLVTVSLWQPRLRCSPSFLLRPLQPASWSILKSVYCSSGMKLPVRPSSECSSQEVYFSAPEFAFFTVITLESKPLIAKVSVTLISCDSLHIFSLSPWNVPLKADFKAS